MGSKTKTTSNTNQTNTNAPPTFTQPGLTLAGDMTTQALANLPTTAYSGPMVAQPGNVQGVVDAYGNAANTAGQMSTFLQGQLPGLTTAPTFGTTLPTAQYDAGNGTDLTPAIQAAIHPVFQQLQEQVLPGIRSSALDSGAYSGDRAMSVLPEMAIRDSTDSANRIAAQLGYEDYQAREARRLSGFEEDQNRALAGYNADTTRTLGTGDLMTSRMAQLPNLVDTILRASTGQGDILRGASDYQQTADQAQINDALQRDQYGQTRPFMGLDVASQILQRLSGNYGTQTGTGSTTQTQSTGGLGSVVQGLMGLASLAAAIPTGGASLAAGGAMGGGASGSWVPLASTIFGGH